MTITEPNPHYLPLDQPQADDEERFGLTVAGVRALGAPRLIARAADPRAEVAWSAGLGRWYEVPR